MKAEFFIIIILITGAGSLVTYFIISNWWSQMHQTMPHGTSCSDELKEFEGNIMVSTRQQTEMIVMSNQTLKKLIDESSYCEFMGLSTLYTENGTYQALNINLNDIKELSVEVNLRNSSVVSYDLSHLTRNYPAP